MVLLVLLQFLQQSHLLVAEEAVAKVLVLAVQVVQVVAVVTQEAQAEQVILHQFLHLKVFQE
tara:strand:+ start:90 stop:275 length:186 start_codon:yes stop_codon:yes gene_type:complete